MSDIVSAAAHLRNNALVAFPTETVYGLGANACSEEAVLKIFAAKGRPSDNPLIVHVPDLGSANFFLETVDPLSLLLADTFWPGPLTLVLRVKPGLLAPQVTAGLDTVGVRVPDHPVALALLRECRLPLAAPSANKSGSPSPTTAQHVRDDYKTGGGPEMVLDGGPCRVGLESTVIRVVDNKIHILRPGAVSKEHLLKVPGVTEDMIIDGSGAIRNSTTDGPPRAPGMKYRHYAPIAPVKLVDTWEEVSIQSGDFIIAFDDVVIALMDSAKRVSLGSDPTDLEIASMRLFAALRQADTEQARRVLIDVRFDHTHGIGAALWNRISKAGSLN